MTVAKPFNDELFDRVSTAVKPGDIVTTLGTARPNWIFSVDRDGVWVETERSKERGSGPQLVPAGMVATAWEALRRHGRLSQKELLGPLNVKRSAFVCALLARFPDVDIESDRPVALRLRRAQLV